MRKIRNDYNDMDILMKEFLESPLSNGAFRDALKRRSRNWLRYFANYILCQVAEQHGEHKGRLKRLMEGNWVAGRLK